MVFTVYMVNFKMFKGSFPTGQEAVDHAKALGFECAIYENYNTTSKMDWDQMYFVETIKPY